MDRPLAVLGTPGVGFFSLLLIGVIAGWIAERVTKSDHGLLTNILVGVAGSFVGTRLAETLDIVVHGFLGRIIAASVGAIIVLFLWRAIRGQGQPRSPLG